MPLIALFSHPDPKKRTRYRVGTGIGISLLLHILFFTFFLLQSQTPKEQSQVKGDMPPLEVSFITQQPKPKAAPTPAPAPKAPTPPAPKTPPRKAAPPVKPAPVQEAIKQPEIAKLPPEADMSTMLNAARARRHAAEADAAQENAAARAAEGPKSANDIAKANIEFQANKKSGGQNGVFQILTKGPRVASYAFYGWTNQSRFSERQVFQVDAGSGGNVELAIVDSMIALIRKYYPGDFNWDSQRLGRVVILSARAADNAGLQNFLMQEFFGR
jgi:hypothetical protein